MKVNGDSMNNEAKIQQFLDNNRGYISTSDFLDLNISKPMTAHIRNFLCQRVKGQNCLQIPL